MDKKIFLSYCQKNENEAEAIDTAFLKKGIELTKDKRDLKYKQSLKEFMKGIREHDYAILLISHEYLTSENCMYEFLQVLKEKDFENKILPLILVHNFYDSNCRVKYSEQWKNKVEKLENEMEELSAKKMWLSIENKSKELKKYKKIELEIDSIINELQERKMLNFYDEQQNGFNTIFREVGVEIKKEDTDTFFSKLNNKKLEEESQSKTNISIPKVDVFFKSHESINCNKENKKRNNYENEKQKLIKGIVDNDVIYYITEILVKKDMLCKFIIKYGEDNLTDISNVILKLNNELQEKVMKNIKNNHAEATGYGNWGNY
uniref:toll/interleukin-1 receptor domain-containing protein n=1 Tax=Fusobacterium sp. TaxID=68766 RepID=UPI00263296CD